MNNSFSRRSFIKKGVVALGTVAAFDLTGIVSTGRGSAFKVLASEGLKENNMSHVSVKLFPGRSEQTKQRLADAIVEDVVNIIGGDEASVSVSIEDVSSSDWKQQVYDPEIRGNKKNLYKKPGYSM
ncbi:MAG: tautomerase family protein [Thermodesulfobacteriota bacterium]